MPRAQQTEDVVLGPDGFPHHAEDLSRDDDLCSYMLVDQLGCERLPDKRLGVHPQQVKFVGPPIKTADVLNIVQEVIQGGNMADAVKKLEEMPVFQDHLALKHNAKRRKNALLHVQLYLQVYHPTSRVEIWRTNRYTEVSGHTELAIYATSSLAKHAVLTELQGSCANLPDEWREDMEHANWGEVSGGEGEDDGDDEDGDEDAGESPEATEKRKAREKEKEIRRRRSGRTGRRDFSIIWSERRRHYQLFLGPARFLNHDCEPNVSLYRAENGRVTFQCLRDIAIGEELTTCYGDNYFDKGNMKCMCLTCEKNGRGFYAGKPVVNGLESERAGGSRSASAAPSSRARAMSSVRPSMVPGDESAGDESEVEDTTIASGPETPAAVLTPKKNNHLRHLNSPAPESVVSEVDSNADDSPRKERPFRAVRKQSKPFQWTKRLPRKEHSASVTRELLDDPEGIDRCVTCVDALTERLWDNLTSSYDSHCPRCTRHALVFQLPWPAHSPDKVKVYPPTHLTPLNYQPRPVACVPLPSLGPKPKKKIEPDPEAVRQELQELDLTLPTATREDRAHWRLLAEIEREQGWIDHLRAMEFEWQEARDQAKAAQEEARAAAKQAREEEKRKKNEGKIRGSGLWQRYEVVDLDEFERKKKERDTVVSGTRSGRKFTVTKPQDVDEDEVLREAQARVDAEREREKLADIKSKAWRVMNKDRLQTYKAKGKAKPAVLLPTTSPKAGPSRGRGAAGLTAAAPPPAKSSVSPRRNHSWLPVMTVANECPIDLTLDTSDEEDSVMVVSDSDDRPPPSKRLPATPARHGRRAVTEATADATSEDEQPRKRPVPIKSRAAIGTRLPVTRAPASTPSGSDSTATPRRPRGRPPGTGHVQKRMAKQVEREEASKRKRAEKEAHVSDRMARDPDSRLNNGHHQAVPLHSPPRPPTGKWHGASRREFFSFEPRDHDLSASPTSVAPPLRAYRGSAGAGGAGAGAAVPRRVHETFRTSSASAVSSSAVPSVEEASPPSVGDLDDSHESFTSAELDAGMDSGSDPAELPRPPSVVQAAAAVHTPTTEKKRKRLSDASSSTTSSSSKRKRVFFHSRLHTEFDAVNKPTHPSVAILPRPRFTLL